MGMGGRRSPVPESSSDRDRTIAELEKKQRQAEQDSLKIAEQLRPRNGSVPDRENAAELQRRLSEVVTRAFEIRLQLQKARMDDLQSKLDEIQQSVESREKNRDRIIERRIEQLLDPSVDWQTLTRPANPSPQRLRRTDAATGEIRSTWPIPFAIGSDDATDTQLTIPEPVAHESSPAETPSPAMKDAYQYQNDADDPEKLILQMERLHRAVENQQSIVKWIRSEIRLLQKSWSDLTEAERLRGSEILFRNDAKFGRGDINVRQNVRQSVISGWPAPPHETAYDIMRHSVLKVRLEDLRRSIDQLSTLFGISANSGLTINPGCRFWNWNSAKQNLRNRSRRKIALKRNSSSLRELSIHRISQRLDSRSWPHTAVQKAGQTWSSLGQIGKRHPEFNPEGYDAGIKSYREFLKSAEADLKQSQEEAMERESR